MLLCPATFYLNHIYRFHPNRINFATRATELHTNGKKIIQKIMNLYHEKKGLFNKEGVALNRRSFYFLRYK